MWYIKVMRDGSGNTTLYLKDKSLYHKRIFDIKEKWFSLYQEQLSSSDVVQRGLESLITNLENEEGVRTNVGSRKISDQYSRIGE